MSGGIFTGTRRGKGWWKEHSLSLALLILLVAQSVAYHFLEWPQFVSEARAHGEPFTERSYWNHYWAEWMASVLADTYGALLLVLFSKWFFERGSAESKNKDPQQS